MANTRSDKTIDTIEAKTFVVSHSPGTSALGGPSELTVEIAVSDGQDPTRPIRIVTQNEGLMAKYAAPTSTTVAYGIGAILNPDEARRLAKALNAAANSVDPKPTTGGAFSIPLG